MYPLLWRAEDHLSVASSVCLAVRTKRPDQDDKAISGVFFNGMLKIWPGSLSNRARKDRFQFPRIFQNPF